jgi:hypothetical protein
MTNKRYLEEMLKIAERRHGENTRVAQGLRLQLQHMKQETPACEKPLKQQLQAGFRKAKESEGARSKPGY